MIEIEVNKISGVGSFEAKLEGGREVYLVGEKVFLVKNANTVEVRTDGNLAKMLKEKYESVMDSRYFGRRGIEVVLSGQIAKEEVEDLIRLSFNMSAEL